MKRMICALLVLLLVGAPVAHAGVPQLSGRLIPAAKQAAVCMASGDYAGMAAALPFAGTGPDASEWKKFANSYSFSGRAQTEYAVAFWSGDSWAVAVPLQVPDSGGVEVLVLLSRDGAGFSGYRHATWSQVDAGIHASDHVIWDREYVSAAPQVFAD